MTAFHSQAVPPVGDGSSDGHSAIRFGFVAEPIVDLAHFDPCALYSECLARLMIADSVLLQGVDFIGDIESLGDIGSFDRAMVQLVLDVLHEERHAVLGCNVSPATLADRDTWRSLVDLIAKRPWLAGRLTLEVTESRSLHEIPDSVSRLAEVQQLGCRLALYDFGAGHTIGCQRHGVDIDWDIVKLDRTCFGDPEGLGIDRRKLDIMVAAASRLAPILVVQGIETPRHLAAARDAGARFGQGWMFEGPVQQHWTRPDAETRGILERAMTRDRSSPQTFCASRAGSCFDQVLVRLSASPPSLSGLSRQ